MIMRGEQEDEVFDFCLGVQPNMRICSFFATTTPHDIPDDMYPELDYCFRLPQNYGWI